MHSQVYLTICAVSICGILLFGSPALPVLVMATALAVSFLGVPHGGLDHWTGRRLLRAKFKTLWWAVFFPAYLFVSMLFSVGWFILPVFTVLLFFLASAWHFGREDQQASFLDSKISLSSQVGTHVAATAIGGLVIWVPALARPEEMSSLLGLILPSTRADAAVRIVELTQLFSVFLIPIAAMIVAAKLVESPWGSVRWVPVATAAVAVCLPILASFSIFFCGWHSWQGLRRMRHSEAITIGQFARHVVPLSVTAVLMVAAAAWVMREWPTETLNHVQSSESLRAVFIGLSAIAVPHLLLHEYDAYSRAKLSFVNGDANEDASKDSSTFEPFASHQVCS